MTKKAKTIITFADSAVSDLEGIRLWYEGEGVPDVGKRLIEEILEQVERLIEFPESSRMVPEFGIANLREIIFPPFRIVYRLDQSKIRIVRIWHSERLLKLP